MLATSLASVAVGLLGSVVVARALGPAGKGSYDLMLATAGLLVTILGLSLESAISYAVARTQSVAASLVLALGLIALCQAIVGGAVLLVAQSTPLGTALTPEDVGPAAAAPTGLLVGGTLMIAYLRSILLGGGRSTAVNWRDLTGRVVGFAAIVLGVAVASSGVLGAEQPALLLLWLAAAVAALMVLVFLAAIRRQIDRHAPLHLGLALRFAAPAYLANLAQFLNYRLDLFLVSFFLGVEQVGLYAAATMFGQLLWLGANAVATLLLPRVARESSDGHPHARSAARLARLVFFASAAGALLLGVAAGSLVPLLLGSDFAASVAPLLLLLPGIVAFAPVKVLAAYVAGAGLPRLFLAVSLSSLAVTIALDLIMIPATGIIGAAAASTASYVTAAVLMVWIFRRTTGIALREVLTPTAEDARTALRAVTSGRSPVP